MNQIVTILDFVYECIKDYLILLNSHWYTQMILYTVVLGFVVSTILVLRGK